MLLSAAPSRAFGVCGLPEIKRDATSPAPKQAIASTIRPQSSAVENSVIAASLQNIGGLLDIRMRDRRCYGVNQCLQVLISSGSRITPAFQFAGARPLRSRVARDSCSYGQLGLPCPARQLRALTERARWRDTAGARGSAEMHAHMARLVLLRFLMAVADLARGGLAGLAQRRAARPAVRPDQFARRTIRPGSMRLDSIRLDS